MLRWLRVPAAAFAAYVLSIAAGVASATVLNSLCPGGTRDDLGMCEAGWFASALLSLAALTAALFAYLVVTWTARAAPSRHVHVAAITLGLGFVAVAAYSAVTSLWALLPAASLSGLVAFGRVRRGAQAAT